MKKRFLFNVIKSCSVLLILIICSIGCSNIDVQKLNEKAAELMQKGDTDGAIARLESIQDLNPNFPQTNYNLGIAYQNKKLYEKSELYLERAIELKPDFAEAYLALSIVNEELANHIISTLQSSTTDNSSNQTLMKPEEKEKLVKFLQKAQKYLEEYMKYPQSLQNKDIYTAKLKEYETNISKYSLQNLEPKKDS